MSHVKVRWLVLKSCDLLRNVVWGNFPQCWPLHSCVSCTISRGERDTRWVTVITKVLFVAVTKFRLCNNCRIRVNLNFHWNWTWHLTAAVVMATKREKRVKEEGERRYRTSSILLSYMVAVPTLATILPTLETSTTWAPGHTQLVRGDYITNDDVILQLHVLHHFYKPTCKTNNFLTAEHA